jgi:protein arginine kinase activator
LGCPYDYVVFEKELQPLLLNIHGETQHKGKRPTHSAELSRKHTELIRYRRQLQEAIQEENYELASRLRDKIREIEESSSE